LTQELKSKENIKGSAKRGVEKKRGEKGETLVKPYPCERKRSERNKEAQERHQKTSRWTIPGSSSVHHSHAVKEVNKGGKNRTFRGRSV